MGTVRYRADRRLWAYVDATGRRVREAIGPGDESKRLAKKILQQREAEAVLGQHRVLPTQTPHFGGFADDWLRRQRTRGLRPATIVSYEGTVNVHLRPIFGEQRLGAITRAGVEGFVTAKREGGTKRGRKGKRVPLSATTVGYTLRILKAILADAVEQGHLADSPAARVKRLRNTGDERTATLPHAHRHPPPAWRCAAAVAHFVRSGRPHRHAARRTSGLRWRDVDLAKRIVHVRRSLGRMKDGDGYVVREAPLKTRASRRTIDLSPALVQTLLAFPAGDDSELDYVFRSQAGGPLDPDNVDRAFKPHLTLAELPDEIRFHDLRHTHASLLIAAGVHPKAIQARLGHTSITTTLNRYGHLMPDAFAGVGARLDTLLASEGERLVSEPMAKGALR
jgi:integrase